MLDHSPDNVREALKQYMAARGLTRKGWAKAANLASVNVITNFLNGHSASISTQNLSKLAAFTGDPIEVLIGTKPDPKGVQNRTLNEDSEMLGSLSGQLTESEVQNLQLILQELRSIRKSQERLTDAVLSLVEAVKSDDSVERTALEKRTRLENTGEESKRRNER